MPQEKQPRRVIAMAARRKRNGETRRGGGGGGRRVGGGRAGGRKWMEQVGRREEREKNGMGGSKRKGRASGRIEGGETHLYELVINPQPCFNPLLHREEPRSASDFTELGRETWQRFSPMENAGKGKLQRRIRNGGWSKWRPEGGW